MCQVQINLGGLTGQCIDGIQTIYLYRLYKDLTSKFLEDWLQQKSKEDRMARMLWLSHYLLKQGHQSECINELYG